MHRPKLLFLFLFTILMVAGVSAQSVTVHGRVEDSAKAPIAGAVVVLRNKTTGLERLVNTDSEGRFSFGGLSMQGYEVIVRANGFSRKNESFDSNRSDLIIVLEPEPLRETVLF